MGQHVLEDRVKALERENEDLRDRLLNMGAMTQAAIEQAEAERDALRGFARWAMETAFEGCDADGGEIQDKLGELGLIVRAEGGYDPRKHGEHDCAPGDPFYVPSAALGEE